MFTEKIVNFLKGFVEITARGGFPERFINLCSKNGINIQNIKMFGNTITASCDIKSYLKIRPVAKKSGMKVRMTKKCGLPFFLHKKRNRIGIIFGFVFLIFATAFLSGRIWVVEVKGNENIPAEKIEEYFYEMGVKTGIKRNSVNVKDKAREALKKIDGLMWTAVNADGCRITIEVKESVEEETENKKDGLPSNIVASNSGQIIKIENFLGTPVAEVGSAVEKGDIIVSGAVINKDETVSFYKADAKVTARTKNTVTGTCPFVMDMRVYKKNKNKIFLVFFNLCLPLNYVKAPEENYNFSQGVDFLYADGTTLPLGIITERYASYEKKKVNLTSCAAKLMSAEKYFRETDEKLDGIEIEKASVTVKSDKFSSTVQSVFECIEDISESEAMDLRTDEAE